MGIFVVSTLNQLFERGYCAQIKCSKNEVFNVKTTFFEISFVVPFFPFSILHSTSLKVNESWYITFFAVSGFIYLQRIYVFAVDL